MSLVSEGMALRDAGIQLALENTEKSIPGWQEMAYQQLIRFIRYFPKRKFLAEDVRQWAYEKGLPVPPNHRAWGGVIARAKKEGIISFAGHGQVSNPKAHKANASYWKKVVA